MSDPNETPAPPQYDPPDSLTANVRAHHLDLMAQAAWIEWDELKPESQQRWRETVAFASAPYRNGLRDFKEKYSDMLRNLNHAEGEAVSFRGEVERLKAELAHASAEYEKMVRRYTVNFDPYSLQAMAEAAAKLSGRKMTPEWWIDTVASIRNWVMGDATIMGWGDYEAEDEEDKTPPVDPIDTFLERAMDRVKDKLIEIIQETVAEVTLAPYPEEARTPPLPKKPT